MLSVIRTVGAVIIDDLKSHRIQLELVENIKPINLIAGDNTYRIDNKYNYYYVGKLYMGTSKTEIPVHWDTGS